MLRSFVVFASLVCVSAAGRAAPAVLPSLLVQPPNPNPDVDPGIAEALGEMLSAELNKTGVFSSVTSTRDVMDVVLHEQRRQAVGCSDGTDSCLAEIGGLLGANHLAVLGLARIEKTYVASLKVIDVAAAKVLFRESRTLQSLEGAGPIVNELARKLAAAVVEAAPESSDDADRAARREKARALREAADATAKEGERKRLDSLARDTPDMVLVPSGEFFFGCNPAVDKECFDSEKPGRKLDLPAFKIDRLEATHAEYEACVDAGACTAPDTDRQGCLYGTWFTGSSPINCVDWKQATAFCAWKGKRLPSAREWEKAARGTDGRRYPWGNDAGENPPAQLATNSEALASVGSFEAGASPYGALDMAGNVSEWTASSYDGKRYEYRGGGYMGPLRFARTSDRHRADGANRQTDLGFRCAL